MDLDAIDLRILRQLQRDGSLSNVELSRRVHLSESPCLARVKALERSGVIRGYVALVDPHALGLGLSVYITVNLQAQGVGALRGFERLVQAYEEVMECHLMTGDDDYLLRVAVADVPALERFIVERLQTIAGVGKIRTSLALKAVCSRTELPLPQAHARHH